MRSFLSALSILILAALLVGAAAVFVVGEIRAPGPLAAGKIVLVERGWGAPKIAAALEAEGVISRALWFRLAAKARGVEGALKAGEYEFAAGVSVEEALRKIAAGEVFPRALTIPEGLTSLQIVELVAAAPALSGKIETVPAEGLLLPETYAYVYGDTRQSIIDRMAGAMKAALAELWPKRAADLPFSTQGEAVALAAIIEKETGVAAERALVAGVFVNRLRAGMKLQSDPTVIYALTRGAPQAKGQGPIGRRLLVRDLAIDSPYNTYKYAGIPPGPIANPGRESLAAALNPERHDFLYFVADGTGGHEFSRTLEEHNRKVARWREIRRAREAPGP